MKFPKLMKITAIPPTRKPCKFCGVDQVGRCGFYYEDLCPDSDPEDLERARERHREEP